MAGLSRKKISRYEKIITPNSAYFKTLKRGDQRYLRILSKDWPTWLDSFIATPEMKRLKFVTSPRNYTALYKTNSPDALRHAVASALIVWNFEKDEKSALAALLENIATPVFSLNLPRPSLSESLESSEKILKLLAKFELTPKNLINNLPLASKIESYFSAANLSNNQIERFYSNLELKTSGLKDLAFKDIKIAEDFVKVVDKALQESSNEKAAFAKDFLKTSVETLIEEGELTEKALYHLTEPDIIKLIKKSKNKTLAADFTKFKNQKRFKKPAKRPKRIKSKRFDPLVRVEASLSVHSGEEEIRYARLSEI